MLNQKDHKPLGPEGLPNTTAMCGASHTINQRISDISTDYLNSLFQCEETSKTKSTENFLNSIDKLNQLIREGKVNDKLIMIGSLDVEALYPSTDIKKACQIVKERIKKSPMKHENIDFRWALIYLALTMTK